MFQLIKITGSLQWGCAAEGAEPSSRSSLDEPFQLCLIPAMGKAFEKCQSLPGREVLRYPQVLTLCVPKKVGVQNPTVKVRMVTGMEISLLPALL